MVSLIQSNYEGFGSGLVAAGFGLQDRGSLFNMQVPPRPLHPPKPPCIRKPALKAITETTPSVERPSHQAQSAMGTKQRQLSPFASGGRCKPIRTWQAAVPHHNPGLRNHSGFGGQGAAVALLRCHGRQHAAARSPPPAAPPAPPHPPACVASTLLHRLRHLPALASPPPQPQPLPLAAPRRSL